MTDYVNALRFMAEDIHSGIGPVPEVKTLSGAADELERLKEALIESQAREAKLRETFGPLLAELMDTAVSNGANSISMPDAYVEAAVMLSATHDNSALKEFKRKVLLDAAARLCTQRNSIPATGHEFANVLRILAEEV